MKRLLFAVVACSALWISACSSGSSSTPPPPPAGNFSLSSLTGTYAFTTSGEVFSNAGEANLTRTGSFTADGKGDINAGGVYDTVIAGGASNQAIPITGGSYTVNADGRGTLTLNVNASGVATSINFGFVLTSGSSGTSPATSGLMIDETSNASQASTGSGNFVMQTAADFQISNISGTYVFDFSGLDASPAPLSIVGEVTVSNGLTTGGFEDSNDNFALGSGPIGGGGSFIADPVNMATAGRGTVTIAGQPFAFYIVDSNRVRLISSNAVSGPMLSGDAVFQDNTIPTNVSSINSSFAFLVAGSTANGGVTRLCRFTADGSSVTKVLLDTNNAGTQFIPTNGATNASISLDSANPGRGILTFLEQGQSSNVPSSFVFYLNSASQGVIQQTTTNTATGAVIAVADGSIDAQSGGPFSSSNITGTYAMNWSGLVTAGGSFANTDEEDQLAQVKVSSLSFSGTSDIFQFTSATLTPKTDIATSGNITFNGGDGTGDDGNRVNMNVTLSGQNAIEMVVYIVSPQLAFFADQNNSSGRVVAGVLEAQQ